jgi:DNA polymerase III sliding clamp (beta) subunit (PCNA family)
MKAKTMKELLNLMSKIVNKKAIIPICECVLFEDNNMIVTDLENTLIIPFGYTDKPACVNFKELQDYFKALSSDNSFTLGFKDKFFVNSNGLISYFSVLPAEEFPTYKFPKHKVDMLEGLFRNDLDILANSYDFTSNDEYKPALHNIHIRGEYIEATDGNQLVNTKRKYTHLNYNCDYLIGKKAIPVIIKANQVMVYLIHKPKEEKKYLKFVMNFDYATITLIHYESNEKYPDVPSVFSTNKYPGLTFSISQVSTLVSILKNMQTISKIRCVFNYADNKFTIKSTDIDLEKESVATLPAKLSIHDKCVQTKIEFAISPVNLLKYIEKFKPSNLNFMIPGDYSYETTKNDKDEEEMVLVDGNPVVKEVKIGFNKPYFFNDNYLFMPVILKYD